MSSPIANVPYAIGLAQPGNAGLTCCNLLLNRSAGDNAVVTTSGGFTWRISSGQSAALTRDLRWHHEDLEVAR